MNKYILPVIGVSFLAVSCGSQKRGSTELTQPGDLTVTGADPHGGDSVDRAGQGGGASVRLSQLIYSGRRNPQHIFASESDFSELRDRLSNLPPAGAPNWPVLGMRGFMLSNNGVSGLPERVRVFSGVIRTIQSGQVQYFLDARGLEGFLGQQQFDVPDGQGNEDLPSGAPSGPADDYPLSGSEPPYEPGRWNMPMVQDDNNCYNYGCNKMTNTYAQPGRASGAQWTEFTCGSVGGAAVLDGLVWSSCDQACPAGSYKVALVIWPNTDYHWLRQDNNGRWSHKTGDDEATDKDNAGNLITDPKTAVTNYTTFCCCYCVNPNTVNIR